MAIKEGRRTAFQKRLRTLQARLASRPITDQIRLAADFLSDPRMDAPERIRWTVAVLESVLARLKKWSPE